MSKPEGKCATRRLLVALLGIVTGAVLYQQTDFRLLFRLVPPQYITVTQPRLVHSLSALVSVEPDDRLEKFIVIGSSGLYHALNEDFINTELAARGLDMRVVMVSQESLTPADLLAYMDYLPVRTGAPANIVFAWSFWNFDIDFGEALVEKSRFIRSFDKSYPLLSELEEGNYDDLLAHSAMGSSWEVIRKRNGVPRHDRLSTWTRYYVLDKIQKIGTGRWQYLLRDPPAFATRASLRPKALAALEQTLELPKTRLQVDRNVEHLRAEAEKLFNVGENPTKRERLTAYVPRLIDRIATKAQAKGYRFWLYELPSNRRAMAGSPADGFRRVLGARMAEVETVDSCYLRDADENGGPFSAPKMWWDFVHMTDIGMSVFSPIFLDHLVTVSRKLSSSDAQPRGCG